MNGFSCLSHFPGRSTRQRNESDGNQVIHNAGIVLTDESCSWGVLSDEGCGEEH